MFADFTSFFYKVASLILLIIELALIPSLLPVVLLIVLSVSFFYIFLGAGSVQFPLLLVFRILSLIILSRSQQKLILLHRSIHIDYPLNNLFHWLFNYLLNSELLFNNLNPFNKSRLFLVFILFKFLYGFHNEGVI